MQPSPRMLPSKWKTSGEIERIAAGEAGWKVCHKDRRANVFEDALGPGSTLLTTDYMVTFRQNL